MAPECLSKSLGARGRPAVAELCAAVRITAHGPEQPFQPQHGGGGGAQRAPDRGGRRGCYRKGKRAKAKSKRYRQGCLVPFICYLLPGSAAAVGAGDLEIFGA